jgi:hypothetical protein
MNANHLCYFLVLLAAALVVAGCGVQPAGQQPASGPSDLADRLTGKWHGAGQADAAGLDPAAADTLGAAMGQCEMTAEFRADGTSSLFLIVGGLPDPDPRIGSWKIAERDGPRAIVECTDSSNGNTIRAEIEFIDNDRLTYRDTGDSAMPAFLLLRVSEAADGSGESTSGAGS